MSTGDSYKRRSVAPGEYQCGCRWAKWEGGDQLIECQIHKAATESSVRAFDRERAAQAQAKGNTHG